jgi:Leucine-rich repeat (LRR) protein
VSGRFDPKSPCVLRGIWRHTKSTATGRFTFRITAPKTFKGNWSSGDADPDVAGSSWTGTRLAAPMVALPKNISLSQLKLEQAKLRARLNSEYHKAYREILNGQIAEVTALRKKYSQQRDNQKAAAATQMLAELRRLLDSLPPEEKRMPPEEPEPDGPGLIKDSKLEAALCKALGKPQGVITASDLASLKKLEASFLGITDISGLEHATNLTHLNLSHNPISDITPLAGLTNLKRLLLYKIRISNLKPLADLTNVEFVTFWETNVSDLSPLKSWKKLKSIELRLTKVTDYTPLHDLTHLNNLSTNRRLISDEQEAQLKQALPNCKLEIEKRNLQRQ